jgi:hypothetical protein
MKKIVFVLIDGLADVSLSSLGGRTPLQAAQTPAMDALAGASISRSFVIPCQFQHTRTTIFAVNGLLGLMDPVEPGLACGSDTAHLSLFGFERFPSQHNIALHYTHFTRHPIHNKDTQHRTHSAQDTTTIHTTQNTQHTTHNTLRTTHYTRSTTHNTLHTAHCTLHTTHYTLHTTQYTLRTTP